MGNIKKFMLEAKARKELGTEQYYMLREEFLKAFNSICSSLIGDNDGRKLVRQMKEFKDKMWLDSLFEFLGSAALVVSVWRSDIYSLKETIVGCVAGTIIATVAYLKKRQDRDSYNDTKNELIDYVVGKANKLKDEQLGTGVEENIPLNDTARVVYRDAADDLVY